MPEAWVFETGTNQWRRYDAWPPQAAEPQVALSSAPAGSWPFEPPARTGRAAFDEYVSDPAKPVPFIDKIAIGMSREYMIDDQRFAAPAARRAGLSDRRRWTRTSPSPARSRPSLHVSTTGTDSRLGRQADRRLPGRLSRSRTRTRRACSMGGYQQLVRGDVMRGKFRNSFEKPEPFEPGKPTAVEFTLPDVCHTFRTRPPDHGPGAEHAGSRWWTATRRRSATSTTPASRTSRRRRSGSTARRTPARRSS